MDLRNYLLIPTSSHLVLAKGGKTIGAAFTGTKPPLWVFQNLGCPEFSFFLLMTFGAVRHVVQELERDIHTGIMVGEAGWQREVILYPRSFGTFLLLISPELGQRRHQPQWRSLILPAVEKDGHRKDRQPHQRAQSTA